VWQDVIPYGMVKGNRSNLSGLNLIGLERRGFPKETIKALRRAYRYLFGPEGTLAERIEDVARDYPDIEPVCEILDFMRGKSSIGLCQPKTAANGG
ncbi:MAG: acyl-[acyl-carrier-protein]--UDP-N-acetylglucosamine O-acyltransferase, partial [Pseudomonadota bacterium]|nr:acyl-[acyl-carrier-protein]--UDP-N-acetylglucosamine O-acyltransferase [Pseudomonadota bacterium]